MSGWQALMWGATCAIGVIVFLKEVADEVGRVEATLAQLERTNTEKLRKLQAGGEEEEVVTAEVA